MSKLNLPESETSILTAIQGLGLDVYEVEMPDDKALKYNRFGKLAAPFYVVTFAGPLRTDYGDRSLSGADSDPWKNVVGVQTYAGDTDSLRSAHSDVLDLLTGFYPDGSSELVFGGGNSFSMASNVSRPTIYARVAFYTYSTNLTSSA